MKKPPTSAPAGATANCLCKLVEQFERIPNGTPVVLPQLSVLFFINTRQMSIVFVLDSLSSWIFIVSQEQSFIHSIELLRLLLFYQLPPRRFVIIQVAVRKAVDALVRSLILCDIIIYEQIDVDYMVYSCAFV